MSITENLESFSSIDLETTIASAGLLDRVDTKYVIRPDQLPDLLGQWSSTHRILEIGGKRIFHYSSLYYDTPGFDLYHAHHAGVANRVKFRLREYTDTQLRYYEAKERSNKGVTQKYRIRLQAPDDVRSLLGDAEGNYTRQLRRSALGQVLQIDYERITLVAIRGVERITIDWGLAYQAAGRAIRFDDRVIIEVKHERGTRSSERELFRKIGIRPGSISKYCLGILSLYPQVKKNTFKPKLRALAKQLRHNGVTSTISGFRTGTI